LLITEKETVPIIQDHRKADAAGIDEGAVAASQIHQGKVPGVAALDERVQARDRTAIEHDDTAVAAADRPGLPIGQGEASTERFQNQTRLYRGRVHLSPI
jgi:hypothetical protein